MKVNKKLKKTAQLLLRGLNIVIFQVPEGVTLPLPLGEVAERSEDGEGTKNGSYPHSRLNFDHSAGHGTCSVGD